MTESTRSGIEAYEFLRKKIDTVPHLEALMLLWNSRPVAWTCEELASRLYIPSERATELLRDLVRLQLIQESQTPPLKYAYFAHSQRQDKLMEMVDAAYRKDLVGISTMIHGKASSPVREFARAFRFKKERP